MVTRKVAPRKSKAARATGYGTGPVFLTAISTILGAILFLRFGYAVGNLGVAGTLLIILLGHLVTIPTGMAVAEIATNRRVEGGGAYFILSRSFGSRIGGAIGIGLYFSEAVSVAFYMIAFAEAFVPALPWIEQISGLRPPTAAIALIFTLLLFVVVLKAGTKFGIGTLWVVVSILAVSLTFFFLGEGPPEIRPDRPFGLTVAVPDPLSRVFAIVFPAFTGMTVGLGLSGDLRDPKRSIPLGTLAATFAGMVIYIFVTIKLASNATPEALVSQDPLVMSQIALWGPIIPIGLGAATLSSAIGSLLAAPRTLQALARDNILTSSRLNEYLARGRGRGQEPVHATLVSGVVILPLVLLGSVDLVAQIITMFFMVTYGALCTVSFLEHFAGNPSYRPTFRSRWYLSLLGAVMAFMLMFQISPGLALLALFLMLGIYRGLKYSHAEERSLSAILQGVMFQATRRLQIAVQRSRGSTQGRDWRPSVIALTRHSMDRLTHFDLLRWICHRHGFGQFYQYIEGNLTVDSEMNSRLVAEHLIERTAASQAGVFVETIIAPSFHNALAHLVQMPGVSGLPNNTVLFEFSASHPKEIDEIVTGVKMVTPLGFNTCILRSTELRFGYRQSIHIWLTADDPTNSPLMILLAYIIVGHPDWSSAEIRIFACTPSETADESMKKLDEMITEGRLPIARQNLTQIPYSDEASFDRAVEMHSSDADLVIIGFVYSEIEEDASKCLMAHPTLNDILFVNANEQIPIS